MRRSLGRRRAVEEDTIDLTPLIDVVFIMLIFFICTTSFVKESGVAINRPAATTGEPKSDSGTIFIGVDASERLWIENKPVDLQMLRPRLERMKTDSTEPGVVIQSDKQVSTGTLIAVMDQVRLAGITEVAVATKTAS